MKNQRLTKRRMIGWISQQPARRKRLKTSFKVSIPHLRLGTVEQFWTRSVDVVHLGSFSNMFSRLIDIPIPTCLSLL